MVDAATLAAQTTITTLIKNYYKRIWLKRLEAELHYDRNGKQEPIPKGEGDVIVWHRLTNPGAGYDLGEGSSPNASAISTTRVSAQLAKRGWLQSVSDYVEMTSVCPIVQETVAAQGYGAALTRDRYISGEIGFGSAASTGVADAASTSLPSVFSKGFPVLEGNSNTVTWPSTGFTVDLENGFFSTVTAISHIRRAVTHLKNMNAIPYSGGTYRAVVDPLISDQIRSDSDFVSWMQFTGVDNMKRGRLGIIERVEFDESSEAINVAVLASAWSTGYTSGGGTLRGTLIHGMEAYGVSKLMGKDAEIMVVTGADKNDPLNQTTMIGYKFYLAAKILNPSSGVILTYFEQSAP